MNILASLNSCSSQLEGFIDDNYQEIHDFFLTQPTLELLVYRKEVKRYIRQFRKEIISLNCSKKINGDFIVILIDVCEKLHLFMEFGLLYDYLSKCDYRLGDRLQATHYYCSGIKRFDDYYEKYPFILSLLKSSYAKEEDTREQLTATFLNFYLHILYNFGENNKNGVVDLRNKIYDSLSGIDFLDKELIDSIFNIEISDYKNSYSDSVERFNNYLYQTGLIVCQNENHISIEISQYAQKINNLQNPNFEKIKEISKDYIMNIGNPDTLHYELNQGVTVIQKEELLYKYLFNYGKMHKAKLYSSFKIVIDQLDGKNINIIDWGCGQALASSLLIDYIKERKLDITLSNIILVEPSGLALGRGLLHIDVLKDTKIDIRAINKEIDCLEVSDLVINNSNITLHIFSNILDVELFKLDREFLDKFSYSQKGLNYFICVSPNINDKRNARLDMFHRYFMDNFEAESISLRDSSIENYKRYEKVFKVNIDN